MEFKTEINAAIKSGLEGFKRFIDQKLQTKMDYLKNPFWVEGGDQITVLNYLIQQHHEINQEEEGAVAEDASDLTAFIDYVISKAQDKNVGEPLHYSLIWGKIQLTLYLLEKSVFDVNRRDDEGRTLLSLVLATKNCLLLKKLLESEADVNAITCITEARVPFQPLHQAIVLDFAYGVRNLGIREADLANPMGLTKDTPVLLASRLGKIKALEALLEFPEEQLNLEAESNQLVSENNTGENAVELLCRLLLRDRNNKDLIRGVAMLLCRGVESPRSEVFQQLLTDKRSDLLKEVDRYLETRPELVDQFVNRCHLVENALHGIVYVDYSWKSAFRQLLGKPNEEAFIVEKLVTRKYSRQQEGHIKSPLLPTIAAEPLKGDEPPLKLYAEFVRRYSEAYENQRITNPWSTMRWKIAQGKCNWETVKQYALSHPGTRTRIIYDDMFKILPKIEPHEQLEQTKAETLLSYSQ